jgi:hypothetical protein
MRAHAILVVVAMAACGTTLPHPRYVPQPTSALTEVSSPPPPGRIEVVPNRPSHAAVWVDGEWTWRRQRWAWTPGGWVEPPPGAGFAPWAFVRGPDGRLWVAAGTWRDAGGAVHVPAPSPRASATVESTQVVNASGALEMTGPTLKPSAVPAPTPHD